MQVSANLARKSLVTLLNAAMERRPTTEHLVEKGIIVAAPDHIE